MTIGASISDELLKWEAVSLLKQGASPDAALSLGFCSPSQHCGGKDSVHTPSWHDSIPVSSPSHEQHIENASNSSQGNREICWELNTPTYLSRNRVPRNRHIQQITQSANYLQSVPVGTPQTHYLAGIALQWKGAEGSKANVEEREKPRGLRKGELREGSRQLRWWTGKAREWISRCP